MATRFTFKVGGRNLNSDYAQVVTVIADTHEEARRKAITIRGYAPNEAATWFIKADEIEPSEEIVEKLMQRLENTILNRDKTDG